MSRTRNHATGFTILEMLVAVALIGILSAIAFPSYRSYVERTHRTVAKTAISNILARQESYATDHKRYTGDFSRLGYSGSGTSTTAYVNSRGDISLTATNALYSLELKASGTVATCSGLSGTPGDYSYIVLATPVSAKIDSRCNSLCMAATGERGASGDAESCWQR